MASLRPASSLLKPFRRLADLDKHQNLDLFPLDTKKYLFKFLCLRGKPQKKQIQIQSSHRAVLSDIFVSQAIHSVSFEELELILVESCFGIGGVFFSFLGGGGGGFPPAAAPALKPGAADWSDASSLPTAICLSCLVMKSQESRLQADPVFVYFWNEENG